MSRTFGYPAGKTYTTLWDMVNPERGLLLGIGKTSSWPVDSAPPDVDLAATEQEELACYFPIATRKVARRVGAAGAGVTEFAGQFYQVVEVESLANIEAAQATHLYLEAVVDHNLMPNNSFRSIGLYRYVTYSGGIDPESAVFLPDDVSCALYFIEHFEPIPKTTNLLQTFKIIVKG